MYYESKKSRANDEFLGLSDLGEDSYQLIAPEAPVSPDVPGGQMVVPDPSYNRPSGGQVISYVPTKPITVPGNQGLPPSRMQPQKPGFVWIAPPKNVPITTRPTKPKIQLIPEPEDEADYDSSSKAIPTSRMPIATDAKKVIPTNRMPNVVDAPIGMSIAERQKEFGELLPPLGTKTVASEPSFNVKSAETSIAKTSSPSLASQSVASAEKLSGTLEWLSNKIAGKETSLLDALGVTSGIMSGVKLSLAAAQVPQGKEESDVAVWESIAKLKDFGKTAASFSKIGEAFSSGNASNSDMAKAGAYIDKKFRPLMEEAGIRLINGYPGRMGNLINAVVATLGDTMTEFGTKSGTDEKEIQARVDAIIDKNAPAFRPNTGDADFYVKFNFGKGKAEAALRQKEIQAQKRSWGPEHDVD